jgi:hypothetical protein
VLADSVRAIGGAPESTCGYAGAFRKLQDLTIGIVKFGSHCELCAGLTEILRSAEISAEALQETWCHILTAVVLRVPQPQGISFIIFVFVTVTIFASALYGMMYYLGSLCVYTYGDTGKTEMDPATGSI